MPRDNEVRYFESHDGARIAYAVSGSGPPVLLLPSWLTHLDFQRRSVAWAPFLEVLSQGHSLIRFDPRGSGLSDRDIADLRFDDWVRDVGALLDHLGFGEVSLIGTCQGGAVAIDYAARAPGRVGRLVLFGAYARGRNRRGDLPLEMEQARVMLDMIRVGWGRDDHGFTTAFASQFQPDGGAGHLRSWCELQRRAASPEGAAAMTQIMFDIDVRSALGIIGCPALVAHARGDAVVPVEEGRLIAKSLPRARFLELDSRNHFLRTDEPAWPVFAEALRAFLPQDQELGTFAELTTRERQVVERIARGEGNADIGTALGISEKTVRNHVTQILAKLDIPTRSKLIVRARDSGFGVAKE